MHSLPNDDYFQICVPRVILPKLDDALNYVLGDAREKVVRVLSASLRWIPVYMWRLGDEEGWTRRFRTERLDDARWYVMVTGGPMTSTVGVG